MMHSLRTIAICCGCFVSLVGTSLAQPRMTLSTDLLWMTRDRPASEVLVVDQDPFQSILHAGQMHFDVGIGARIETLFNVTDNHSLELEYFGIMELKSRHSRVRDDGDGFTFNDPIIYYFDEFHFPGTTFTADYTSDLHSAEVNWHGENVLFVRPFGGIRWVQHAEQLDVYRTDVSAERTQLDFDNNLIGGHFGLSMKLWSSSTLRVESEVKVGSLANFMDMSGNVSGGGGTVASIDRTFQKVAFVGELGVSCVWQPSPQFAIRIGYNGLVLDRVGLAADQHDDFILATQAGTVDLGTISYHGGHAGMELTW